jgi:hypothetical protein
MAVFDNGTKTGCGVFLRHQAGRFGGVALFSEEVRYGLLAHLAQGFGERFFFGDARRVGEFRCELRRRDFFASRDTERAVQATRIFTHRLLNPLFLCHFLFSVRLIVSSVWLYQVHEPFSWLGLPFGES